MPNDTKHPLTDLLYGQEARIKNLEDNQHRIIQETENLTDYVKLLTGIVVIISVSLLYYFAKN